MQGIVTADREALLPLTVLGVSGQAVQINTLLDTGYDGTIILPPDIIRALGLPGRGTRTVTLANNQTAQLDVFRVTVLWHGQPRSIEALAAEGGPLVGMSLLYGSRLHMDILDDAMFTLEPLP